ncbi:tyrosine-type recombinase/integrase [Campylobacter suis]|uniref:Tyr recombinase domain-containing protein n=1 Tax=Campylobacter suis TaxID=2790657 RepID=A0ABN7K2X9_9BACT|nr:tyrosine-type recombinase/integrase [Campylobacter suis]CAD7286877.1 hypothetical protein LMG8286_00585 [Campylobacter suis]
MFDFKKMRNWIDSQRNTKEIPTRIKIPDSPRWRLEISPKQKKTIKLYTNIDNKVNYISIGEYPIDSFESMLKETQRLQDTIREGKKPIPRKIFKDVWNNFIDNYVNKNLKLKSNTIKGYKNRANKYILNTNIANKAIGDITLDDLKRNIFNPNENKPATNYKLYSILLNCFKYAKKYGHIENNILANFDFSEEYELPSRKTSKHHPKLINEKDLAEFLKNIMNLEILNNRRKILVLLTLETAMRSMNIFDLRWRDINLNDKTITITKNRMKGELRTEKSRQDFILPLSDTMTEILSILKDKEKGNDKVFTNVSDQKINNLLKKISGITKHGLRGTFKTFCMKNLKNHNIHNIFIELYMYHQPAKNEVEAAYMELSYKDKDIQKELRVLANWWDKYLISLYDFKSILIGE